MTCVRSRNLPAKPAEEAQKHRQQYEEMVVLAKRRGRSACTRVRARPLTRAHACRAEGGSEEAEAAGGAPPAGGEHRLGRAHLEPGHTAQLEQPVSGAATPLTPAGRDALTCLWLSRRCTSRRVRELWWRGVPPSVRGKVWSLAVGNDLNITPGRLAAASGGAANGAAAASGGVASGGVASGGVANGVAVLSLQSCSTSVWPGPRRGGGAARLQRRSLKVRAAPGPPAARRARRRRACAQTRALWTASPAWS